MKTYANFPILLILWTLEVPIICGCISAPEQQKELGAFPDLLSCIVESSDGKGEKDIQIGFAVGERVSEVLSRNKEQFGIGKDQKRICVARPIRSNPTDDEILPVDWTNSNQIGNPDTNYKLALGDRIFVCRRITPIGGSFIFRLTIWDRLGLWIDSISD
ncbi:MAG: hypothetical protein ACJ8FY_02475 [Gemmataceae bacterium]